MGYPVLIFLVVVGLLIGGVQMLSPYISNGINGGDSDEDLDDPGEDGLFTKSQIEAKLKRLADTPPPKDLAFGAMCYSIGMSPEQAKYTCPVCGDTTIWKSSRNKVNDFEYWHVIDDIRHGITAVKRELKKVKGVTIRLDESQFCKKCSPTITAPKICIMVHFPGKEDTSQVCGVNYVDIRGLNAFLAGKLKYKTANDGEQPLKYRIEGIKYFLGMIKNWDPTRAYRAFIDGDDANDAMNKPQDRKNKKWDGHLPFVPVRLSDAPALYKEEPNPYLFGKKNSLRPTDYNVPLPHFDSANSNDEQ